MCHEQYAVAGGDAEEGDESDDGGYAEDTRSDADAGDAAYEGEGQVGEYYGGGSDTFELGVEEEADDEEGE